MVLLKKLNKKFPGRKPLTKCAAHVHADKSSALVSSFKMLGALPSLRHISLSCDAYLRTCVTLILYILVFLSVLDYIECFPSYSADKRRPDPLVSFY